MLKFAANLTLLFKEVPMLERFAAAAASGFDYVEMQLPYAWPAAQLREILLENKLEMVLHNLPAGDWDAGERGIACHPNRVSEYREGVERGIAWAQVMGVKQLNCLAGIKPTNISDTQALDCFLENLVFTSQRLQQVGIQALIEPINTFDNPGFFLSRTDQAAQIIDMTGQDNLFIEYDIYHAQRQEGDLGNTLRRFLSKILHIQLADNPGRHQPGTGEINYPFIFALLEELKFEGFVSAEYNPRGATANSFAWCEQWLPRLHRERTPLAA